MGRRCTGHEKSAKKHVYNMETNIWLSEYLAIMGKHDFNAVADLYT